MLNVLNSLNHLVNDDKFDCDSWVSFISKDMNLMNDFSFGQEGNEEYMAYEMPMLEEATDQLPCHVPSLVEPPMLEHHDNINKFLLGVPIHELPDHDSSFMLHLFHDPFFLNTCEISFQQFQGNNSVEHERQPIENSSWRDTNEEILKKKFLGRD